MGISQWLGAVGSAYQRQAADPGQLLVDGPTRCSLLEGVVQRALCTELCGWESGVWRGGWRGSWAVACTVPTAGRWPAPTELERPNTCPLLHLLPLPCQHYAVQPAWGTRAPPCMSPQARTCDQAGRLQADAHERQHVGVVHISHQLRFPLEFPQLARAERLRLPCPTPLAAAQEQLLDSKGRALVVCKPHLQGRREAG